MATFNWGDLKQAADDAGFSAVPAGPYTVTVKKAEAKKTGTGKDKINVQFTINAGPMSGKTLFNDFVISPESGTALGFFFRHMKALGLNHEYFATNPPLEKVAADLVGKSCEVEVGIRLWNEEEKNEIKSLKALGTPSGAPAAGGGVPQPQPAPVPQPVAQPQPQPAPAPQPASVPTPVSVAKDEPVKDVADVATPPEMPF